MVCVCGHKCAERANYCPTCGRQQKNAPFILEPGRVYRADPTLKKLKDIHTHNKSAQCEKE